MGAEAQLERLGIKLPDLPEPQGNYAHSVKTGSLLFLAGKGPYREDGSVPVGKVGRDFTIEEAYQFARTAGTFLLAAVREALGNLDRVQRVVKVFGMVNAVPDFGDQPQVINGCSDLFVEVFGERGRHARSAIGVGSLPREMPVEIEAIVEIE
ncbi:MAG TPA: RidA family protein [bacterium]|nr:RidA family protein [bacterium]